MFLIIGTRRISKVFGAWERARCNRCDNISEWLLVRVTDWLALFFIPIIPFSTSYYEQCPVCKGAVRLSKEAFMEKVGDMNRKQQSQ